MSDKPRYSLAPVRDEFTMTMPDGSVERCAFVSVSGDDQAAWMTATETKLQRDVTGRPIGMADHTGVMPLLISMGLVKVTPEGDVKFPAVDVGKWPYSVQRDLFDDIRKANGINLTDEEEDELKKSSTTTETGSD